MPRRQRTSRENEGRKKDKTEKRQAGFINHKKIQAFLVIKENFEFL
jgi:hypothetical protein